MLSLIDYRCIVEFYKGIVAIVLLRVSQKIKIKINSIPDDRQHEIEIYYISFGSVDLFNRKLSISCLAYPVHDDVCLRKGPVGWDVLPDIEM